MNMLLAQEKVQLHLHFKQPASALLKRLVLGLLKSKAFFQKEKGL
jgi:hypothetical protein